MKRTFRWALLVMVLPLAGCRMFRECLVDSALDLVFGESRKSEPDVETPHHWDRNIAPYRSD